MLTADQKTVNLEKFLGLVATRIDGDPFGGERQWVKMLISLAEDVTHEGVTYLGLRNAPAGKGNHHAYEGGLIQHYLEMWQTYINWRSLLPVPDPLITESNVLKGIIIHDLHKAWCEFVRDPAVDTGLNYGRHPSGNLVGNDQKSMYLINQAGIKLDLVLSNLLYTSEGGWAKAPPRWCTTLSKLVYLLDEFSGNIISRIEDGTHFNVRTQLGLEPSFEVQLGV